MTADRSAHRWSALRNPLTLGRLALAASGGVLAWASFPPRTLWWLAPIAVAMLVVSLMPGRDGPVSKKFGFILGVAFGLGYFLPLLPWIGVYVGPLPWIALAAVQSLYIGGFGILAVIVGRVRGGAVWIASAWSAAEWVRSTVPFGGFPWGRLAFGQSESPLIGIAALGGAPLLTFAVAMIGSGLAYLLRALWQARTPSAKRRAAAVRSVAGATAATVLWPLVALAVHPSLAAARDGDRTIVVAAIQGSVPRLGLDFNSQRRQVLDNHVQETLRLADAVDSGSVPAPDVVVWPENASDIDPLRNADAAAEISAASERIGAPILVGAVLVNADRTTTNSVIVWSGEAGPGERHDKKIIQPFGEYLPFRSFFRLFSSYADAAGNFVPGSGNGVVHVDDRRNLAGPADLPVGVATCYEVAFDRALQESVDNGAQIIAVPTNNATFGDTEMTYQQLAMSRVRAVEHSRTVVVAATSGVSAIVAPDGSVVERTPLFTPEFLVSSVVVRSGTTLATRLGPSVEYVLIALAVGATALGVFRARRASTGFTTTQSAPAAAEEDRDEVS